jgi:hypothetical protein
VRLRLEWAEEHWEAVGMMVSVVCALTVATTLAVAFNVISTRLDGLHQDAGHAVPPTRNERSETRHPSR